MQQLYNRECLSFKSYEHTGVFNIIDMPVCSGYLINMNGRVYDPILAMFLSPDNYVQAPEITRGLNRYSYSFNNPLKYTDPSGNFAIWEFLVGNALIYTMGWLNNVLELGMSPAEAFRNTPVVFSASGTFSFGKNSSYSAFYYYSSTSYTQYDLFATQDYLGDGIFSDAAFYASGTVCNDAITIDNSFTPILFTDFKVGLTYLINGCFVDNNSKNLWKYERLAFVTRLGLVVLPGSGKGWTNGVTNCKPSLDAGIKAGVINGHYITVGGRVLTIERTIHIHPSCNQLVAIGNIDKQYCNMIVTGPSYWDSLAFGSYDSFFVYDFNTPNIIYEWKGIQYESGFKTREHPFNDNLNLRHDLSW